MATHKLTFEDFDSDDFSLIAIYTTLDDYLLAYKLNCACNLNLKRSKEDIVYSENELHSFYDAHHMPTDNYLALLKNKSEVSNIKNENELFTFNKVAFILPEFSKADFFLKIEPQNKELTESIINKIKSIQQVSTVRYIAHNAIKNKRNLIF